MFTMALYDFLNDSFHLNFQIIREKSNLEPITIRFDVGHPVDKKWFIEGTKY